MTICTENCNQSIQSGLYGISVDLFKRVNQWFQRQEIKNSIRQERKQLLTMSEQLLKDIGITREQALEEASRDDVPATRLSGRF